MNAARWTMQMFLMNLLEITLDLGNFHEYEYPENRGLGGQE